MRAALLLCLGLAVSCASAPKPRVLFDVEALAQGAQARESKTLAPQAHARAELLAKRAEAAHQDGDPASAQILSEHAIAAYGHAFVLARLARAETDLAQATRELSAAKTALGDIDEKHRRVAAEADDLELRIRVAEDAIPLAPNAPAGPAREKARLEAARALASQAQLLCVAARLLQPKRDGLGAELDKVAELDRALAGTPKATPIDTAVALRSSCLRHLTDARRAATHDAPGAGLADALLDELSRSGSFHAFRDDRGVVVTLRGLFDAKGGLTKDGLTALQALGRVAKAHTAFPVLVVLHGKSGDDARRKTVTDALAAAGAPRVESVSAGTAQPVVDPSRTGAGPRNDRIEVVFVAPAS
ncbi:MAG: hypothetical protein IPI67_16170 [Myxococcales bacterium]|nr:hypothetical protein [Myxococcales bacterium]